MSFLITSHGRTGTMWLANLLNESEKWTVGHEPRGNLDDVRFDSWAMYNIEVPSIVRELFKNPYYGEVNSVLKYYFFDIQADKKAIIYRDWKDVLLSFINKRRNIFYKIAEINYFHSLFYNYWKDGKCEMIWYDLMTSDLEYCQGIIDWLGVDVTVTQRHLDTVINGNHDRLYDKWDDMPEHIISFIENLEWVNYYG